MVGPIDYHKTYFYCYNTLESKSKIVNLKNQKINFPNLYEHWKIGSKELSQVKNKIYDLIKYLENEIDFIKKVDSYIKTKHVLNCDEVDNSYYGKPEFKKYMDNIYKLYYVGYLSDYDDFVLKYYLYNKSITKFSDYAFIPENAYYIEERIVGNLYFLRLFIFNLKYIINKLDKKEELDKKEIKFMIFLYNFDYYFLTIMYKKHYKFLCNMSGHIDDYLSNTSLVNVNLQLSNLSLESTLDGFKEVFGIDFLSKFISYKNGSMEDLNNNLFLHLLYIHDQHVENTYRNNDSDYYTFNRSIVDPNNNSTILVTPEKLTLDYLEKVIKGICYINKYTHIPSECYIDAFSETFEDELIEEDPRYDTFI